jgi:protein O-mannosyl-transferase
MNKKHKNKGSPTRQPASNQVREINFPFLKKYSALTGPAVIILLGALIYSNSFYCSFHFDDYPNIVDNLKIQKLSDVSAWWNFYPTRPLGFFTFALNYHFSRLNVVSWHAVNLIIHLINSCLVWVMTIFVFSSPVMKDNSLAKHGKTIALFTALLFVSHPLATQSVTYIVQRLASLVAMFYLLSIVLYMKGRMTGKGRGMKIALFTGAFLSALLAMLTKENAFTLPLAIILTEIFFFRTKKIHINYKDWRLFLLVAAFFSVMIIIPLEVSFSVFKPIPPSLGHNETTGPVNYLFTQFSVMLKYMQLLIFPVNQMLDYDFPLAKSFFETRTMLGFLVITGLVILSIFLYKKQRVISFGILWFFLTLAIESTIIPIVDVIYEHRTYLPSVGYFLILVTLLSGLMAKGSKTVRLVIMVIMAIMVIINSWLTFERNKVWKDNLSLWTDNVAKTPNLARPVSNRGVACGELGMREQAIADYSRAIELDPRYVIASFNRGVAYGETGQWEKAAEDYTRILMRDPGYTKAWFNRGMANENLGRWKDAASDYSKAIALEPGNAKAFYGRGLARMNLAKWDSALADFSASLRIDTGYAQAWSAMGIVYGNLGQWDNAIDGYTKAVMLDPGLRDAWSNRGTAYQNKGLWDKAISDYTKALQIDPAFATALFNRAVAFGNSGQWDKAVADYSKVLELNPGFTQAYANRQMAIQNLKSKIQNPK